MWQMRPAQITRVVSQVLLVALLLIASLRPASGHAASPAPDTKESPAADAYSDPLGRENPRSMQIGLTSALSQLDDARLAQFLDVSDPASKQAIAKARAFRAVLDQSGDLVSRIGISIAPEGSVEDGLPPDEEKIGKFTINNRSIPIIAKRVSQDDGHQIWLVSAETLAEIPVRRDDIKIAEQGVSETPEGLILFGARLRSWVVLFGVGFGIFGLITVVFRILHNRFEMRAGNPHIQAIINVAVAAFPPLALIAVYSAMSELATPLGAGLIERITILRYSGIVVWIGGAWLFWRLAGVFNTFAVRHLRSKGRAQSIGFVNFMVRVVRLALLAIAASAFLATFGVDVTAGLAALGIGGLALALGARKTVEDLVGSIAILMDKPLQVGDRCKIDGQVGDVVDIGMRSTRIRTLQRTLLTIPNSQLADAQIENLALRDTFLVDQTFGISFDVDGAGIERALGEMRNALEENPDYIPEICPVRFHGFGEAGYTFRIFAHLKCTSHEDGFFRQERLLLDVLRRFDALGIRISAPMRRLEINGGEAA